MLFIFYKFLYGYGNLIYYRNLEDILSFFTDFRGYYTELALVKNDVDFGGSTTVLLIG